MERFGPETRSTLIIREGTVNIRRIEGDSSKPTLIYLSAWGTTKGTNQTNIEAIRSADPTRPVLTYEIVKPGKPPEAANNHIGPAIRLNGEIFWHVIKTSTKDNERLIVAAQSMGTANLVAGIAAHLDIRQTIDASLLVAPAGLFLADSQLQLFGRFLQHNVQGFGHYIRNREKNAHLKTNWLETAASIASNPAKLIQFFKEARDIARLGLYEDLRLLTDAGIRTGILIFDDDKLCPPKQLLAKLRADLDDPVVNMRKLLRGSHHPLAFLTPKQYGRLLAELFSELEAGPAAELVTAEIR